MQKDLTKQNSTTGKNKILVLGLILLILVGIFSPVGLVRADPVTPITTGTGPIIDNSGTTGTGVGTTVTNTTTLTPNLNASVTGTSTITGATVTTGEKPDTKSEFENIINAKLCVFAHPIDGSIGGCIVQTFFLLFYQLPAYLLTQTAYFFNILISVTLNSTLLKDTFVSSAWTVVRDISNIFFILILLYISFKIILGMGGSEVKKMIGSVVIMALLINFSMFFTQIIIDSSNMLALVFYNKISVNTKIAGQTKPRDYDSVGGEKDVAGGMVAAFDPTTPLQPAFFKQAQIIYKDGVKVKTENEVPAATLVALILMAGLIMCIATYALFVAAFSFLGRLIELWVLIIFSPFAFMSFSVPQLKKAEYLGWEAWLKRLITVSFMAPIFMFFLYFIFMLINSNLFTKLIQPSTGTSDAAGTIKMLLGVVMPAIFICVLLLKATEFAKKGGGKFGEFGATVGKMAGGLVAGAYVGGAAIAGRATIGRAGTAMANSRWAKKWESSVFGGEYAMEGFKKMGSGSFDLRGAKIGGQTLASATGMKVGEAQKGGFAERREKDVKKRMERAKEIEVSEDEPLKQAANKAEQDLQGLLNQTAKAFERIDKELVAARQKKADSRAGSSEEAAAIAEIEKLNKDKGAIKDGSLGPTVKGGPNDGKSIKELEKDIIPEAKNKILTENRKRRGEYADKLEGGLNKGWNFLISGGQYSLHRGANESAHKIRMETKMDSGTKT